jgi:uncharacterized protein with von Willebrand factor type A (vWA) domain
MEARIVDFAEVLRQNGLRVSIAEVQDAVSAAAQVGVADRTLFRAALEATLVKREADVPTFLRAFDFYFSGASRTFEALDRSLLQQLEEQGLLEGDELKMVLATLQNLGGQLSPLAEALLQGDRGRLAQLFRAATLQLDLSQMQNTLQTGFFSRRLMASAGGERARSDLQAFEAELKARGISTEGLEVVSRHLAGALRKVEEAARREVEQQSRARVKKPGSGALDDRNLMTLSRAEVEKMEGAVRKLAEKLKSRLTRKARHRRRGQLHVRRTLRRNMTWGGVPMVPVFRSRRPERPEVVILCDVSDSVRNASRMMLLFMHTLQSLFVRVRSFVFVSDVGEVTRYFKEKPVEEAIDLATAGQVISLHGNSNYGHALSRFARDQLGSITRRTTVMVIGDGRNNYNAPNAWALRDLKQKARRLVWICPEDKPNWGFGDSEMHAYARHCHQTVVVQTLNDLERIAEQLVPVT